MAAAENKSPVLTMANLQTLLRRPFGDALKEILTSLQLKSSAHQAADQLRALLKHGGSDGIEELLASPVPQLLVQIVRDGPGLPAAGSAMHVLAVLALSADGRARLRVEGGLPAVVKFLAVPGTLQKPNAEPALLLVQNAACDKQCRQLMRKMDAVQVLLELLQQAAWLRHHNELSAPIAGALTNLVVTESGGSHSGGSDAVAMVKQSFVKAGGIEVTCKALAEWGRASATPATARLRLLLADVSNSPQFAIRVQETPLDVSSLSARSLMAGSGNINSPRISSPSTAAANAASASPDTGGHTICTKPTLGTVRMPASHRISAEVLLHAKPSHGGVEVDADIAVQVPETRR
eukprot:gene9419-9584_t